ncbi:hypothetical protein [Parasutterella excrementihominis]
MTMRKTLTEVKMMMEMRGWTHEQVITINNEYDGITEGIAEVVSKNPNVPYEIHFNEGFKYDAEKDELTTQKDDSLYGIWWFTPNFDVIDTNGEIIDSWDLDQQGFRPEFSNVDYSEIIENAKASQE